MCFWPFVLHVHATATTGYHSKERRDFEYADRCSQCRVKLSQSTHVAAHVVSYPCFCFNCCIGMISLKTTCRHCNNQNRIGKRCVDSSSCMACTSYDERSISPTLGIVCYPWCLHYQFAPCGVVGMERSG